MSAKCEVCYGQHLTCDHNQAVREGGTGSELAAPSGYAAAVLVHELLYWTQGQKGLSQHHLKHAPPEANNYQYHQGIVDALDVIEAKVVRLCAEMGVSSERQPQHIDGAKPQRPA